MSCSPNVALVGNESAVRYPLHVLMVAALCAIAAAQEPSVAAEAASRPASRPSGSMAATAAVVATTIATADGRIVAALQAESTRIVRETMPGVVTVRAYQRASTTEPTPAPSEDAENTGWDSAAFNDDYPGFRLVGGGSGFFVDAGGDVLTCLHALQKKDGSFVDLIDVELFDRTRLVCDVVGAEPTVNLAVLRASFAPAGGGRPLFTPLVFGDSDRPEPGERMIALGDPAGPERFAAAAMFIAKPSRDCYQELLSSFYMQASFVAPPQAYGGPLMSMSGEVMGIVSPRAPKPGSACLEPRYGIELVLPSKIVAGLYAALKEARSIRSPWLGFSVMSREELAVEKGLAAFAAMDKPKNGILIENVFRPGPAVLAGIEPGDFLVGFDRYKVFAPVDFQRYLYLAGIGRTVTLEIYRRGETLTKTLEIKLRPPEAAPR